MVDENRFKHKSDSCVLINDANTFLFVDVNQKNWGKAINAVESSVGC